jgi:hypothetical protein
MTYITEKKTKRTRKLRCDSKYDPKFTEELLNGIRYKKKLSIPELCRKWRISRQTYWNWREMYQEFSDAADLAELDYVAYWMELNRDVCEGKKKGNAQLIALALANIEQLGWSPKVDIQGNKEEKISTININVIPAKPIKELEHKPANIIEGELADNVVRLPVEKND